MGKYNHRVTVSGLPFGSAFTLTVPGVGGGNRGGGGRRGGGKGGGKRSLNAKVPIQKTIQELATVLIFYILILL